MSENTSRYRRWFEYEKAAHLKTLASLDAAAPGFGEKPEFEKALMLFGHLAAARQLWLYRLRVLPEESKQFFPESLSLADARRWNEDVQQRWNEYLQQLDDDQLARSFKYTSLDGARFRNSTEDILTQLFGHSLYHRGQIALLLRSIGAEPAATDFVYWARESVSNE